MTQSPPEVLAVRLRSLTLCLAAFLAVVSFGCNLSHSKVGKLVGVSMQMPMDDAVSGQSNNVQYLGTVYVRLEDKTEIQAVCDMKLLHTLRGGQRPVVEPLDGKGKWKVVRALDLKGK